MTFSTPIFNQSFENEENEIPVLIIENKAMYQKFICDMMNEIAGIESEHAFFIGDTMLDLHKDLELVMDMFSIDINKTKNITKLYGYMKSEYVGEEKYLETAKLTADIMQYINDIVREIDYKLIYDEDVDMVSIFKAINLRFYYEETTILEKLIDYIKIMQGFFRKKIFVLTNFKSIFSEQDQLEFYKFVNYNKINILVVETTEPDMRLQGEIYRIIDRDLCVIY